MKRKRKKFLDYKNFNMQNTYSKSGGYAVSPAFCDFVSVIDCKMENICYTSYKSSSDASHAQMAAILQRFCENVK